MHVAHRIDVDQGRDERDHEEHDDAQIVDRDSQRNRQVGLARGDDAGRSCAGGRRTPQDHPVDIARPDERLVRL